MRRLAVVLVTAPAVLLLGSAAWMVVHVQHVLKVTRAEVANEGLLAFDYGPLAPIRNAGFEPLAVPNGYQTGAVFQGRLYLAGPGGLAEFNSLAAPPRWLRTGLDLPPAPVVRMVTGMLRGDSRPQLILATSGEGLLWFDGSGFRQLRPHLAAARDVTALLPLASGDLLVGTRQLGLLRFDGRTLAAFSPGLAGLNITALAGDAGDFWVGTRNRGVFHWHAGQMDSFDGASGLPDPQVEAIGLAPGRAYVGTPVGVEEFDEQGGAMRPARTLAAGFFAHALLAERATLTIASIDQGVREVALAPRPQSRPEGGESLQAEDFLRDSAGENVLAVARNGVFRHTPSGQWAQVLGVAPAPLADRNIAALSFSPNGRLWIGYFDRGLDILSPAARGGDSLRAQHVEDDHVFCVNRIVADPARNTIDVATANGLVLFDQSGHERQVLLRRDGLIADQVTDVSIGARGTVVATAAGLTFIDATGMRSLYAFQGLVNNHVYTLAESPRGNRLLAGTLGGISLLQAEAVQRNLTTSNSGLKHNWITAIVPVDDGWFVGTYGAGVMRLDPSGHFSAMEGAGGPIEINPNAMLVTPRLVFAGSLGQGLLVYDRAGERWSRITAGLPSLNVTAIAEHDGSVYTGTDNGAVRIAEEKLLP